VAASVASEAAALVALAAAWATHSTHSIRVRIGHSPNGIYGMPVGSFWLDVGGPDHLGPLLGIIGQQLPELLWR
jgi:hypothetical protein